MTEFNPLGSRGHASEPVADEGRRSTILFTLWDHRLAWSVASGTRQTTETDRLPYYIAL